MQPIAAAAQAGGVRFSVELEGEEILVYHLATLGEAHKIFSFLKDYFPEARFVFEPVLH
ncbi:MAG: hypothetical protein AAGC92_02405 [Pseudomonadota bacterium]